MSIVRVRQCNEANWWSRSGVAMKRREIEKRGLPSFAGWKLITLTLDPLATANPKEGFEKGRGRLRRFLQKLRDYTGADFPWCWKLEFQENGWAHWHLCIGYARKFPLEVLRDEIPEWWGLGRVNVKAVKRSRFVYLFKYVSKLVASEVDSETGICLPDWVLDYCRTGKDGRRICGIRFWQTGGGFYQQQIVPVTKDRERRFSRIPYTLREQVRMSLRKALVYQKDSEGNYSRSTRIYLWVPWNQFLTDFTLQEVLRRRAALVEDSIECRVEKLRSWTSHPLQQLRCKFR